MLLKAYIVSTGTELLLGQTPDTNSLFISRALTQMGIKVMGKAVVGDNHEYIRRAFSTGLETTDLVICSGGLGPTRDDLTKQVVCEVLGCKLERRPEEEECIKEFFARRHRRMPDSNLRQALFPSDAEALPNPLGTAPGMYLEKDGKTIVLLPGPPREMEPMFRAEVAPRLRRRVGQQKQVVLSRVIKVLGPGESQVEEMLQEVLEDPQGAAIALLAQDGEIHIRITLEDSLERATRTLQELEDRIIGVMGWHVVGFDQDTLPEVVGKLLREAGLQVAFAESCTGGLAAKLITDLPGSSEFFWGGAVSYANEAKMELLGVSESTLSEYGAVSPETAKEMARGIRERAGVDIGISITGIAGPGGGSSEKPVGLVYMGLADNREVKVKEQRFIGGREAVRILTAKSALDWLRRYLIGRG
ncbi:MAG: competence/damage-inducible protein A [Syntrophomonadaceae bacterium]|mgnify:CR=1 FL=1|nr:competence/damage-inducible protein A [Syntrophomonadaceae bacterium]